MHESSSHSTVYYYIYCLRSPAGLKPGCSKVNAEDIGLCDSSDPGFELIESAGEECVEEENNLNVEVEADEGPSASEVEMDGASALV